MNSSQNPQISLILQTIEEGYSRKAWHGPNLRGSMRGLTAKESAWRPAPDRHSIWEIVVHCAYWKYAVRRRLRREKRGSFPLKGSNWFSRPSEAPSEEAWNDDVMLLANSHRALVEVVNDMNDRDLSAIPPGSKVTSRAILTGIAMHDVYHAGQIQIIKRLMP